MTTFRIYSLNAFVIIGLFLLLLTSACGQSNEKKKEQANHTTEVKSAVAKLEIDIQAAILSDNIEAANHTSEV